jgi:hypothetical protein
MFNFQVVNDKIGQAAGPLRCFVRNIFVVVFPIEMIMINPSRRLGDMVAGTKIMIFNPLIKQPKINMLQLGILFVLAYTITPLGTLGVDKSQLN